MYSYETADDSLYKLLKDFAKGNRKHQTDAERALWEMLRGRSLGVPFRRQHVIGDYIADFVCLPKKLVIEVDGGYHNEQHQQILDEQRTVWLEERGYKVLRFTNDEVLLNTNNVILRIKSKIE